MPKIFPIVSKFLTRWNLAQQLQHGIYETRWQDLTIREWVYLRTATQMKLVCEAERMEQGGTDG